MQLTPWTMYWITRLDGINVALCLFAVLVMMFFIWSGISFLISKADGDDRGVKRNSLFLKYCTFFIVITVGPWALIPSTKQMAAILVVPAIVNNETLQQAGANSLDAVNELSKLAKEWAKEQTNAMKEVE